jgi:hypothetical protein
MYYENIDRLFDIHGVEDQFPGYSREFVRYGLIGELEDKYEAEQAQVKYQKMGYMVEYPEAPHITWRKAIDRIVYRQGECLRPGKKSTFSNYPKDMLQHRIDMRLAIPLDFNLDSKVLKSTIFSWVHNRWWSYIHSKEKYKNPLVETAHEKFLWRLRQASWAWSEAHVMLKHFNQLRKELL